VAFDSISQTTMFTHLCWFDFSLPCPLVLFFFFFFFTCGLHQVTVSFTGLGIPCPCYNPGDGDTSGSLKSVRFTPCCLGMVGGISCVSDMNANHSQPCRTGEDLGDNPRCDEKLPEGKNGKKATFLQ